jgi:membrane-associated protease RseP (regulator of RpoE activity)
MPDVDDRQDPAPAAPAGPAPAAPTRWRLPALLFLATCGTTFFAGGLTSSEDGAAFDPVAGAVFAASIMGILLIHEMGHFLAARAHRVNASLPYFLPIPLPPVGTFGAVIRMREPPRTRKALLDIGMSGPLLGLVAAAAVCFVGLLLSEVRTLADLPEGTVMEGNSLLYLLLKHLAHPTLGPSDDVLMHPMAWAGWLGLLVTALNLLPAGQLDGGHVVYALFGERVHTRVARITHALVFVMGLTGLGCQLLLLYGPAQPALEANGLLPWVLRGSGMLVWLVWTVLLRFVGGRHPPAGEDVAPLPPLRRVLGLLALVVLVLTFTPSIWSPLRP